jgi:hypothetical protein
MFNWLKGLFGKTVTSTGEPVKTDNAALDEVVVAPEAPKAEPKKAAKAKKSKKAETVDLESLNKTQLLEEAKKRGVKANASLKKDEILERIKNG